MIQRAEKFSLEENSLDKSRWIKDFVPKKRLGQNFLINPHIKQKIISSCQLQPSDCVLEIGPGQGALTMAIAPYVQKVIAIEKDHELAFGLKEHFKNSNVTVIHGDILKFPFSSLPEKLKIIGNLPYNIATPIIEKVFTHHKQFSSFYMTVQLEYGRRLSAKPNSKDYGSLSCFVQYYAEVKMLFRIKNTAFYPRPKVQSCFIQLDMRKEPKFQIHSEDLFFKILRHAFGQRRKTIQNSLSQVFKKNQLLSVLESLNIDPKLRAENLKLEDYVRITNASGKIL